jgi:hypothetical protein
MIMYGGNQVTAPLILNLGTSWEGGGGQLQAPAALPLVPDKLQNCVEHQADIDSEDKHISHCQESNRDTSVLQPVT